VRRAAAIALTLAAAFGVAKGQAVASSASAFRTQANDPIIAFERTGAIYLMNADGTDQRILTTGYSFAWSPDGTRIAFDRGKGGDIWVIARDGSDLRRIVRNTSRGELTWSPDGKQIVFTGNYVTDRSAIFVVNADGTGLARLTSPPKWADDMLADWSHDGTEIAFERDKYDVSDGGGNDRFSIITMKPDGTGQRVLSREGFVAAPVWSGDGLKLAAELSERLDTQRDIYLLNRDGTSSAEMA
jgi:Tol biopolymer transport system component